MRDNSGANGLNEVFSSLNCVCAQNGDDALRVEKYF
jgi:hypothetical protein